MDQTMRNS